MSTNESGSCSELPVGQLDRLALSINLKGAALEREGARWLEQMAARINQYAGLLENYQQSMLAYAFEIGDMLINVKETGKKLGFIPHGEFGAWCERNVRVKQHQYAKYMKLARQITKESRETFLISDESIRSVYAVLASDEIKGGSGLDGDQGDDTAPEIQKESRETFLDQTYDPPPAPQNPVPEQPITPQPPEPTCEKSTPDEGAEPSEASPPATRTTSRQPVSGKNPAVSAWGDIGVQILGAFSSPYSRTSWNQLAEKRHGIDVAKYALAYYDRAGIPLPTNAVVKTPNARLVLPWLNSPFADEYDLRKAASFQKLKDNFGLIERACQPYFNDHGHDKGNRCFDLFRREAGRHVQEAHEVKVEALRERERKVVNVNNHPAILVYGVELWPDGDLPEHLRLDYDSARWAYFHWRDMESFLTRAEPKVSERAAFWKSRQGSLHRLNYPEGARLSYFWWRAGEAMGKNPDAHMKSNCEPSLNIKY